MRHARKYDRLIEIWQTTNVRNEYGGTEVVTARIGGSYCKIRTLNAQRMIDLGLNENKLAIDIELRNRKDIDYTVRGIFFKYKGTTYNINTIENKDVDGLTLKILAVTGEPINAAYTPDNG
tara:strand:- start:13841 stop:14203 length:363 start_codon:yes stop_codon:yes gene_type:complete